MAEYKFYMEHMGDSASKKDLEAAFVGLRYLKAEGMDNYGKIKNVYTEAYADSSDLRVYVPTKITRDNPDITFTFAFIGDNRRALYHQFVEFISGYKLTYSDTCRKRKVNMVLLEAVSISEDKLFGSTPFMEASFRFKNLSDKSIAV